MMLRVWLGLTIGLALFAATAGHTKARPTPPISAEIAVIPGGEVQLTYRLARPVAALHFVQSLGGYRSAYWQPEVPGVRWISEGDGTRIERSDGAAFDRISFRIAMRYRALPKSYAPFSPFSEGSALIYSGHFHACITASCETPPPLPIAISAPGKIIGVGGRRRAGRAALVSREEGTNIFVGSLKPVAANGFVAVIDPGLPVDARDHLVRSLPRAVEEFAKIYGPLSFHPELYVSIDGRKQPDGHVSTQGGTLPRQIFMHFDGEGARDRLASGSPYWLDWFFAHEAAHLVQQDKAGGQIGDDAIGWIHEGGADAMAAIELAKRGEAERGYVQQRRDEAAAACTAGLAAMPLGKASARGNFDLHYQCGLLIWLALDGAMHKAGAPGLHALNREFLARSRRGAAWDQASFLKTARDLGVPASLISRIERIAAGGYTSAADEVAALGAEAVPIMSPARLGGSN